MKLTKTPQLHPWMCWACYLEDFGEEVWPLGVGYFHPRSAKLRCARCGDVPTTREQLKAALADVRSVAEDIAHDAQSGAAHPAISLAVTISVSTPEALGDGDSTASPHSKSKPRRKTNSQLLSLREAARLLGVDRGKTLPDMISAGAIRAVPFRGGRKVPVSEIERVCAEGLRPLQSKQPRKTTRTHSAKPRVVESEGTKIRRLKL
jgi:hypothetical protein